MLLKSVDLAINTNSKDINKNSKKKTIKKRHRIRS